MVLVLRQSCGAGWYLLQRSMVLAGEIEVKTKRRVGHLPARAWEGDGFVSGFELPK